LEVRNGDAVVVSESVDDATSDTVNVKEWFEIYAVNSSKNGDHDDENWEKHGCRKQPGEACSASLAQRISPNFQHITNL
jgi:hypothetical protein